VFRSIRRWFDPTDMQRVGSNPDYRFSLANERTYLAWIRTGLALIGGGLAVAAFVPPLRWPHVREVIAVGLLLLGAACWPFARWITGHGANRPCGSDSHCPGPDSRPFSPSSSPWAPRSCSSSWSPPDSDNENGTPPPLILLATATRLLPRSAARVEAVRTRGGETRKRARMATQVRAVVVHGKGEQVRVETITVPDPGPGEALVKIQACGVCHTDLHYREGGIGDDFPYLLGHEAAGLVEAVGDGVTEVKPGDFVILNWRAVCGQCRSCRRGRPWYCFNTHNATQKMTLADGTSLSPALGIGAFAEKTLVAAGQCTIVDSEAPATVAGLLGCGVMAGLGAALNTGNVSRGDSVAVFGCGGVGDAAIAGAALAGATTIVAVDIDDQKLEWARQFGATHVVNSRETDPVEAVRAVTGGYGADVTIDAGGCRRCSAAPSMLAITRGTVVMVGVPRPEMTLELPLLDFFGRGGALKSSWYGDCLPSRDFPTLIALFRQGRLPLAGFVSETIGLDDIEAAFARMEHGEVLRSVVVFE